MTTRIYGPAALAQTLAHCEKKKTKKLMREVDVDVGLEKA